MNRGPALVNINSADYTATFKEQGRRPEIAR